MKRKIISLLLTVVLCLNFAICASAAEIDFILDDFDLLSESELESLNSMAMELYEDTGIGIFYVYTTEPNIEDYNVAGLVNGLQDYYVMLENEDSWYYFASGKGEQLDTDALRDAYDGPETYVEGVEAFLAEASFQLTFNEDTPPENDPNEEDLLIWDEAGLLTEGKIMLLHSKLQTLSTKYNAEVRVVTLSSMEGGNVDEFLEFLYDEMGFGYGGNHDGVLLLVCMDPREYRILSNGFAADAITSGDIDIIGEAIVSDLSDGNYAAAFDTFVDQCEYYLDGYINGFPFDVTTSLLIAVGLGLLVAVIVTSVLKGQLKSVRKQNEANAYVKAGTMQITQSGDFFMYSDVTKTEKRESSSSSGSGGSSRNTGGGSF